MNIASSARVMNGVATHQFVVSQYVHVHPVEDGTVGLYTPFGHEVTFLPKALWEAVQSGRHEWISPSILTDLIQRKFIVPPGHDKAILASYAPPPLNGFFLLQLVVIQTCNLGCTYCVVEADKQTLNLPEQPILSRVPKTRMSIEVGRAAVDVFYRNLESAMPPVAKIIFYGGEPLLNKPLIVDLVKYIRAKKPYPGQQLPPDILCLTNGLVYDEELVALFKQNAVGVGVSIDGKKQHHDAVRKRLDGSGSFDRIVENLKRYQAAGLNVGIGCTISKENYEDLEEIARYFAEDLGIKQMQLIPMWQTPDLDNGVHVNMKDAAASAWAAFRKLRASGVEEGMALRRLMRFTEGQFHHRDCGAVGGQMSVAPDGSVGPCQNATIAAPDTFSGNVLDPTCNPIRQPNMIEWAARVPVNMPGCHGCSAISLCGGGCAYNALINKGSIWEKDPQQCGYMEQFLNLLLEDVWERYSRRFAQPFAPVPVHDAFVGHAAG